jgi:hypothetical protein
LPIQTAAIDALAKSLLAVRISGYQHHRVRDSLQLLQLRLVHVVDRDMR